MVQHFVEEEYDTIAISLVGERAMVPCAVENRQALRVGGSKGNRVVVWPIRPELEVTFGMGTEGPDNRGTDVVATDVRPRSISLVEGDARPEPL